MSLTDQTHKIILDKHPIINFALDATCGNGNDTLFLAKLCSENGLIYSFDIQNVAIEKTRELIKNNNLLNKVKLINSTHENISKFNLPPMDVIIFNLGYLPNFNKKICTTSKSTISALNSSLSIIKQFGTISILCYPGHKEGKKETEDIYKFINSLDKNLYSVTEHKSVKPNAKTPILLLLEKKV